MDYISFLLEGQAVERAYVNADYEEKANFEMPPSFLELIHHSL